MTRLRLDQALVIRGLVRSRNQAESYIKLGKVKLNQQVVQKTSTPVNDSDVIQVLAETQYVSRAALKLESAAKLLRLRFDNVLMLDVGSSTGGFTEFALKHGARKVIAVDVGTDQLHPTLRNNPAIELHEKTDIRDFVTDQTIDLVVGDVSFISLREILPHVAQIAPKATIVAMVKPQFEAGKGNVKHKGIIKNDKMRRDILKDFEAWSKKLFVIIDKADSEVAGTHGNRERFYVLRSLK